MARLELSRKMPSVESTAERDPGKAKSGNRLVAAVLVVCATALVACGSDSETDVEPEKMPAPNAGVYSGTFPCDGCPGIPTTLWLRSDRNYFLEQIYRADGAPEPVTSLGRWTWHAETETLELRGAGPLRVFDRPDLQSLVMQTASPLEHRVTRDPMRGNFDAIITLEGTIDLRSEGTTFSECVTGMRIPLLRGGDYSSFARQYRHVAPPGSPAFVEFEARFRWGDDGAPDAVAIHNFLTVRENGRCRTPR